MHSIVIRNKHCVSTYGNRWFLGPSWVLNTMPPRNTAKKTSSRKTQLVCPAKQGRCSSTGVKINRPAFRNRVSQRQCRAKATIITSKKYSNDHLSFAPTSSAPLVKLGDVRAAAWVVPREIAKSRRCTEYSPEYSPFYQKRKC